MICPRCGATDAYVEPFAASVHYVECDCSPPFYAELPPLDTGDRTPGWGQPEGYDPPAPIRGFDPEAGW